MSKAFVLYKIPPGFPPVQIAASLSMDHLMEYTQTLDWERQTGFAGKQEWITNGWVIRPVELV